MQILKYTKDINIGLAQENTDYYVKKALLVLENRVKVGFMWSINSSLLRCNKVMMFFTVCRLGHNSSCKL